MGYKFTPTITYVELGEGKVQVFFRWSRDKPEYEDSLVLELEAFEEFKMFAESPEGRMKHLGNALNWHSHNDDSYSSALVFCIYLFYYFPWNGGIKLSRRVVPEVNENPERSGKGEGKT